MKTAEEMIQNGIITEEQIPELLVERVQYNNQVYAQIKEIVIEEILTRPLRFEVN